MATETVRLDFIRAAMEGLIAAGGGSAPPGALGEQAVAIADAVLGVVYPPPPAAPVTAQKGGK